MSYLEVLHPAFVSDHANDVIDLELRGHGSQGCRIDGPGADEFVKLDGNVSRLRHRNNGTRATNDLRHLRSVAAMSFLQASEFLLIPCGDTNSHPFSKTFVVAAIHSPRLTVSHLMGMSV